MRQTRTDVGVYLARRYGKWRRVLVPYTGNEHDSRAVELALRMGERHELEITILRVIQPGQRLEGPSAVLPVAQPQLTDLGVQLEVVESEDPQETVVQRARDGYDLVIIGASEEWGLQPTLFARRHEELAQSCPASMLIVRKYVPDQRLAASVPDAEEHMVTA